MDAVSQKPKILMVDDDSFLISLYKKRGEELGMELKTALSGQGALDVIKEGFAPDVIALDMSMAGMSGLDVLREIKSGNLAPNAKIIFLSNTTEDTAVEEAKALGAIKFIVKASLLPSQVLDELIKTAQE
jgi:CheY-like chemotaxis protein